MSRSRDNTCSNDDDYPETWNHETLSGYFLSDSPEGCCEMNYFGTYYFCYIFALYSLAEANQ